MSANKQGLPHEDKQRIGWLKLGHLWSALYFFSSIFFVVFVFILITTPADKTAGEQLEEWQSFLGAYLGLLGLMAVETVRHQLEFDRRDAVEGLRVRSDAALLLVEIVTLGESASEIKGQLELYCATLDEEKHGFTAAEHASLVMFEPQLLPAHLVKLPNLSMETERSIFKVCSQTKRLKKNINSLLDPAHGIPLSQKNLEPVIKIAKNIHATAQKIEKDIRPTLKDPKEVNALDQFFANGPQHYYSCSWTGRCPFSKG